MMLCACVKRATKQLIRRNRLLPWINNRRFSLQHTVRPSISVCGIRQFSDKPPRGFEKFTSDSSKDGDKGGPSNKGDEDWRNYFSKNTLVTVGVAAVVGYILLRKQQQANEINWQEFKVHYLNRGEVERVVVVNQNYVRVYLKADAALSTQQYLGFRIGSVESFERNLEAAQRELNIDSASYIPVTYVREMEWLASLVILTLIIRILDYLNNKIAMNVIPQMRRVP